MGDVIRRATTEELLAHAGWLHGLARQLAGEGALAEDAVQETWLTALRGRRPRAGSERPWLARVLRNSLLQGWRRDRSRTDRELAHGREQPRVAPSPDNVVARARGQESLVQAVLELDEPFRSAVLRRYFDGVSSAEMARELGIAPSTVRTRLQRALEILKARLDPEDRPGLLALAGLPLGIASPSTPSSAALVTPAIATGLFMKIGLKTVIGVAALLGLLAVGARTLSKPVDPPEELTLTRGQTLAELAGPALESPETGTRVALPEAPAARSEAPEPAEAEILVPDEPVPAGELHVLVLVQGAPAKEGRVHFYCGNMNGLATNFREDSSTSRRAQIEPDGWARFTEVAPGTIFVGAEVEEGFTQHKKLKLLVARRGAGSARLAQGQRVVLRLGTASLRGRVFDELGSPVVGARVTASGGADQNLGIAWTGLQGQYEIRGLLAGEFDVTAAHHGSWQRGYPGERHQVTLHKGENRALDFGQEQPLPRLIGTLRNAAGDIVPMLGWADTRAALIFEDTRNGSVHRRLCGKTGEFDVGLIPATYRVSLESPHERKTRVLESELLLSNRNTARDFKIPGAILRGVLHRKGVPVDGDALNQTVSLYAPTGNGKSAYSSMIGGDGGYVLSGLAPGTYRVLTFPFEVPEGIEITIHEGDTERHRDLHVD